MPSLDTLSPLVGLLLLAGAAQAQTSTATTATKPSTSTSASASASASRSGKLDRADSSFMHEAAESGLAEVQASQLALTKAVNTQVKSFAQQVVDDHTKANDELKTLAGQKGVALPTEPSMAQRAKMKMLEGADGAAFDRRYADQIGVKAHEDTVKLFRKASTSAKDPDVKAWAAKTLPALEHHLQMAREMKAAADKEGNAKAPGDRKQ